MNSLDWFNEGKKGCLKEMMDEILKEENQKKCGNINFDVEFTNDISRELLEKIMIEIILTIRYFLKQTEIKNEKSRKCSLNITAEVKDSLDLLSFLTLLQEIPRNILDTLNVNLNSYVLQNLQKDFASLKDLKKEKHQSENLKELIKKSLEEIERSEKVQRIVIELNDGYFRSFDFPQLKEFRNLHSELILYEEKIANQEVTIPSRRQDYYKYLENFHELR